MKTMIISIITTVAILGGAVLFIGNNTASNANTSSAANNVSIIDGKQIITINAKGGYSPRVTNATAGLPTIIKVNTQGTFDCSSALTIPTLSYNKNLPPSGETLIDVPPQKAGAKVQGLCAMGMYNFAINFN